MVDTLPEGTDRIIPGAAGPSPEGQPPGTEGGADAESLGDKAAGFRNQATDKVREYAEEGKTRAAAGLDALSKMLNDGAGEIEERLGGAYADYARRAADSVAQFSDAIRGREVDQLLEDARALVRRSPAVAIGAAATAGFLVARLIKAGSEMLEEAAHGTDDTAPAPAEGAADDHSAPGGGTDGKEEPAKPGPDAES